MSNPVLVDFEGGEVSLKTPVLFFASGGRCTWMWVSGSDVETAKRLRKMKTMLGFIALVVDACHCILIQRSNKAIKENSRCHKSLNGKFVLRIHKYTSDIIINQLMDIFSN